MMNRDNDPNNERKRGFPGGILLFVLATILIILTFQNLSTERKAQVSFSHQLEHLVNLDMINHGESRKVSLGDNLVTFSGRFKDQLSTEAKDRYRYIELLNNSHQLKGEKENLSEELSLLSTDVKRAGSIYLGLMGEGIPQGGYPIVDATYNSQDRVNAIALTSQPQESAINLTAIERLGHYATTDTTQSSVALYGSKLSQLVDSFLSPVLGIGSEPIKESLQTLKNKIDKTVNSTTLTPAEKLAVYNESLSTLSPMAKEMGQVVDHVRLLPLRSVRNYLEYLKQYNTVAADISSNSLQLDKARSQVANMIWFFNNKEVSTKALEREDPELYSQWFASAQQEWQGFAQNQGATFKAPDQPRTTVLEKRFKSEQPSKNYLSYLFTFLPVILILFVLYFVFSRQMKGMGSSAMNFGKSPARMLNQDQIKVTFKDVAGVEEAKEELSEIVDFLKNPGKYTALGARIPKGVLCVGPPGTGKTLIAKAVAGEADRPFFSISGSDFVEMFVGVGASRIRDLFAQAKKSAPCIIFIDEIDAVGRHRGAGIGGGHDEREQTLNQLLVEMDGFDTNEGVILMAATNRPDVLDKALLRPGRFDRRIILDLPDVNGRFEILKVHARKIKLDDEVDLMDVARATPGSSGADLMNILNEAALLAARRNRTKVTNPDAREACDKVLYGKERRSMELDKNEKLTTAYHESGHAVVGLVVNHADPVDKVTIIPRGQSLGATYFLPKKNRVNYWKKELHDQLAVLMGGRVAEEIFVEDMSSGASMDITQATNLARSMVCDWGMTETLGTVSYKERSESSNGYLGGGSTVNHYSDETAQAIDAQVRQLIEAGYNRAKEIINENKEAVELMTQMLMEFETLDRKDVDEIMDGTWDIEKKRERVKTLEESHRKVPPPPPEDLENDGYDLNPTPQGA